MSPGNMLGAERPSLGVSSCLLGEQVRYDAGHKREPFVAEALAGGFELRPVCPETGIGLGVPRPPIRLSGDPRAPRVLGVDDPERDVTEALADFGARTAVALAGISGYVFKRGSPSCGLHAVPVFGAGDRIGRGRGAYAARILEAMPLLPAVEETALRVPGPRASFIERVCVYWRWQRRVGDAPGPEAVRDFHARLRLNLLARGPHLARQPGRALRRTGIPPAQLAADYLRSAMRVLSRPATRPGLAQVLQGTLCDTRGVLDRPTRTGLYRLIGAYRAGRIPLSIPLDATRHALHAAGGHPLLEQYLLAPLPGELRLRS